MRHRWTQYRDRAAVAGSLLLPLAVAIALVPFRHQVANTDAALILVTAVVAVAANGYRWAGVIAALSSAVWFDFFLTKPYERFTISRSSDIQSTTLLVVVGVLVTELCVRGRRHHTVAVTEGRYLSALESTARILDSPFTPAFVIDHVASQLSELLDLEECRWESTRFGGLPTLDTDGSIRYADSVWDPTRNGLPRSAFAISVTAHGTPIGRYVATARPGSAPPQLARRCASILAAQLAAGLSANHTVRG